MLADTTVERKAAPPIFDQAVPMLRKKQAGSAGTQREAEDSTMQFMLLSKKGNKSQVSLSWLCKLTAGSVGRHPSGFDHCKQCPNAPARKQSRTGTAQASRSAERKAPRERRSRRRSTVDGQARYQCALYDEQRVISLPELLVLFIQRQRRTVSVSHTPLAVDYKSHARLRAMARSIL